MTNFHRLLSCIPYQGLNWIKKVNSGKGNLADAERVLIILYKNEGWKTICLILLEVQSLDAKHLE
jgi:hypothetical protein